MSQRGPIGAMDQQTARKALEASDKLYYRIGEVSKLTGVKAHVLRYWETEFRWMAPPKSRSKQRLYRKRDIEFVWLLKRLLWDERYTIAGARRRIQELGVEEALESLRTGSDVGASASAKAGKASAGKSKAARSRHSSDGMLGESSVGGSTEWASIKAALDGMRGDLVSLRGVLQEGA